MKRFFIFFLLLTGCISNNIEIKNPVKFSSHPLEEKIFDNVSKIIFTRYRIENKFGENKKFIHKIENYNLDNGKLVSKSENVVNFRGTQTYYSYENGNLSLEEEFDILDYNSWDLQSIKRYEYNKEGLITKIYNELKFDGQTRYYNEKGELIEERYFNEKEPERNRITYYEYDDFQNLIKEVSNNSYKLFTYDLNNNLIKEERFNDNNKVYMEEKFYDANNYLIKENTYGSDGTISQVNEYFIENDRIIESTTTGYGSKFKHKYYYYENGNISEIHSYLNEDDFIRTIHEFKYFYDKP